MDIEEFVRVKIPHFDVFRGDRPNGMFNQKEAWEGREIVIKSLVR